MRNFTGYQLNLSNVKYVLCDYDDTACIHLYINKTRPTDEEWVALCEEGQDNTYTDIIPCRSNPALAWFLSNYFHETEKQIVTWSISTKLTNARKIFVDQHYPEEFREVVVLNNREEKIKYMIDLGKKCGVNRDEILLIEDHPQTLNEAKERGFLGLTTAEINVLYIDTILEERNQRN